MFFSERLKNITKYITAFLGIFSIVLILRYLETNVEFFSDIHNFLSQRELDSGTIGYTYITIAVAVLSLSTISFTILIGRIQHLANEISSQSFDYRVLKDRRTNVTYTLLMLIATLLIIIYLLADFHIYPMMYLSLIVMSIIAIIGLVYSLFFSMIKDISVYAILDYYNNTLDVKLIELEKLMLKHATISAKSEHLNVKLFKNKYQKLLFWRISNIVQEIMRVGDFYSTLNHIFVSELSFIVSNAIQRKDYQLEKYALECTTKLIIHHINWLLIEEKNDRFLPYITKRSPQYGSFINSHLLPIYRIPEQCSCTQDAYSIANIEFSNLVIQVKDLFFEYEQSGILSEMIRQYIQFITQQIKEKSETAYYDYFEAMLRILNEFDSTFFFRLSDQISVGNIVIAKEIVKNFDSPRLFHLLIVQLKLIVKSIEVDYTSVHYQISSYIDVVFKMYELIFIKKNINEDLEILDDWFFMGLSELVNQTTRSINKMFDEEYSLRLMDIRYAYIFSEILHNIIKGFSNNSIIISTILNESAKSRIHGAADYYNEFIQNLIRIITVYLNSYFIDAKDEQSDKLSSFMLPGNERNSIYNIFIDLYLYCLKHYIELTKQGIITTKNMDNYSGFLNSFLLSLRQFQTEDFILDYKRDLVKDFEEEMNNSIRKV